MQKKARHTILFTCCSTCFLVCKELLNAFCILGFGKFPWGRGGETSYFLIGHKSGEINLREAFHKKSFDLFESFQFPDVMLWHTYDVCRPRCIAFN